MKSDDEYTSYATQISTSIAAILFIIPNSRIHYASANINIVPKSLAYARVIDQSVFHPLSLANQLHIAYFSLLSNPIHVSSASGFVTFAPLSQSSK